MYRKLNRKRRIPDISLKDKVFAEYLDLMYNRNLKRKAVRRSKEKEHEDQYNSQVGKNV